MAQAVRVNGEVKARGCCIPYGLFVRLYCGTINDKMYCHMCCHEFSFDQLQIMSEQKFHTRFFMHVVLFILIHPPEQEYPFSARGCYLKTLAFYQVSRE